MLRFGEQRKRVCSVYEPSLLTNHFSSRRKFTPELQKRTPFTFIAASFAARRSATLSAIAMVKGSVLIGALHVPVCAGPEGASTIGRASAARLARAWSTALRAIATTESGVRSAVAANP